MARNALIGWYDRVRRPTPIVPTGGSWTLPLTNLTEINPQIVAESTNSATSSTRFDIDLGAEYTIGLLFAGGIVPTVDPATIRVRTYNAAVANTYDSGLVTMTGTEWIALGRSKWFIPGEAGAVTRTIAVDINSSAVAGAVKIGSFCAFQTITPTLRNIARGWAVEYIDDSESRRVPGGSLYITETRLRRRLNFALPLMNEADATLIKSAMVTTGKAHPLAIVPLPDASAIVIEQNSVYGTMSLAPAIANPFFSSVGRIYESAFALDQLV